jgi:plastocyanin
MQVSVRSTVLVGLVMSLAGCGGGSGGSDPAPNPTGPTTSSALTVSIVGINGRQSFAPNPVTGANGTAVRWKNDDSVVHHIVFDDGSFDSGNLEPGATSAPFSTGSGGAQYHCTIHPTMVGSVNAPTNAPPDCPGGYCG